MKAFPHYASRYAMRENDPDNVYGVFENQRILGESATITVYRIDDGDPRCCDMFGEALRRMDVVQHISGKDAYGHVGGGGYVREIAIVRSVWGDRDETRNQILVANAFEWPRLRHHCYFADSDSYVSFRGVWKETSSMESFAVPWLQERLCALQKKDWYRAKEHATAIRRLLEGMVGVSNPAAGSLSHVLDRKGRWDYQWRTA